MAIHNTTATDLTLDRNALEQLLAQSVRTFEGCAFDDADLDESKRARAVAQARMIAPWLKMTGVCCPVRWSSDTTSSKPPNVSAPSGPPGIVTDKSP